MVESIKTPLSEATVARLRLGETVYLTGTIFTARDKAHQRILNEGPPVDLKNAVVFHCGPLVRKAGNNWKMTGMGPTTSSRMNAVTPELLKRHGVRAIIGKGGMDRGVASAMKKHNAVYLAMTGGCAAIGARAVRGIGVKWLGLGMAEALWILDVERLGPLVVAIDAKGNNLYERVNDRTRKNLKGLV